MAIISSDLNEVCCLSFFVASVSSFHHNSGSCSAKPACGDEMGISVGGEKTEAIGLPVSASSRAAFTEEEPISKPKRYFISKTMRRQFKNYFRVNTYYEARNNLFIFISQIFSMF